MVNHYGMSKEEKRFGLKPKTRKKLTSVLITTVLVLYAIVTMIPFYFLFVRTFVATNETTDLHVWIPGTYKVSKKLAVHTMEEYVRINMDRFRSKFGIPPDAKLKSMWNITDISKKFNIPLDSIIRYLQKQYRFHGWIYTLKPNPKAELLLYRSILNSVIVTSSSLVLLMFLSIFTGFVLAGFKKRWHFWVYSYYLISLVIPPTLIVVPKYVLMNWLHLNETFFALILPFAAGNALSTMIFTSYIATIPQDLADAVKIDGGTRLQYLWHVVVPLCIVPIGSLTVIMLPLSWNQFLEPLIFLTKTKHYTLQLFLRSFIGQNTDDFQAFYTAVFVSIIPMLIVYFSARKLFVKSLMAGAIKG